MSTDTKETTADIGLELHIEQSPGGEVAATVPVRWCVTPALIAELKSRGFVKPKVLLVVQTPMSSYFAGETMTGVNEAVVQALPLEQEMTFVSFSRPGKNTIRAVIVDVPDPDHLVELSRFAKRKRSVFKNQTPDQPSGDLRGSFGLILVPSSHLDVFVPDEMFAPPPSGRRLDLVQRFFPDKAVDQCHFRRRTMSSILCSILLLTVGQIIKFGVTIVGLVLGMRETDWNSLLHPWSATVDEPWGTLKGGPLWYTDEHGNGDPNRFPLWISNPITFTILPSIVFAFMQINAGSNNDTPKLTNAALLSQKLSYPGFWTTVGLVDLALICLTIATVLLVFGVIGAGNVVGSIHDAISGTSKWKNRKALREGKRHQKRLEKNTKLFQDLEAMVCGHASAETSLDALPIGKRTVHLRYLNLKRQVCRPFAK